MIRVSNSRFEKLEYEILNLAVERGEVRFKNVYKLAQASYAPISTKTVAECLHKMVDEEYLEKVISEVTKRPAYRITPRGMEEYWVWRIAKDLRELWVPVRSVIGYKNKEGFTETIVGRYETALKWLQTFFLCFLPRIKEIDNKQIRERALTMITGLNGRLYAEICMYFGRSLLAREDAEEKIAKRFQKIYCEYEAFKNQFLDAHPGLFPQMSDKIKHADEEMRRIRDRLKSYSETS